MNHATTIRYVFAIGDLGKVSTEESNRVHSFFQDKSYGVLNIEGYFEGKDEHSFLVTGDMNTEKYVQQICRDYNQDSYLRIHNDNHTELVFSLGDVISLGVWTNVKQNKPVGPYSIVLGDYFMVQPNEG